MEFITQALLDSYLGKFIDDICATKYHTENHCAHFVSHVLNLNFGQTCTSGKNIRVHEIFRRCETVAAVLDCRNTYAAHLLFVTAPGNVHLKTHEMDNVPKKHIGIALGGNVWHYSNSQQKVITEVADQFIYHYPHQVNGLWIGSIPPGASPHSFGR